MSDPVRATAALEELRAAVARVEAGESPLAPQTQTQTQTQTRAHTPTSAGASRRRSATGRASKRRPDLPDAGLSDAGLRAAAAPDASVSDVGMPWPADSASRPPSWKEAAQDAPALEADGSPTDPAAVARAIVLRQLSHAPKTRQQLRAALARKDCDPDVAESVLDRFTEVGLVDDQAYAEMLVRSRQATKGLAKRALAHELRTKGVDAGLAEEALARVDPAAERRQARHLVDKKLRTLHGLDVQVQTRRLAGMLARKGYPADLAWGVIRDALADSDEHRRD